MKPNILIVDDIPENIELIEAYLGSASVNLITALSGFEALEKIKNMDIALAIIDVRMPIMDGCQLALSINQEKEEDKVPIIFLTANFQNEIDALKGYECGAVDYIFKPINQKILESKVNVFTELHLYKNKLKHESELLRKSTEQLIAANERANAASKKYTELYDFAPSGYFTLNQQGQIIEMNLCGTEMTKFQRVRLINTKFEDYITKECKEEFKLFLDNIFNNKNKISVEFRMMNSNHSEIYVIASGIATDNGENCLLTITDITDRKVAENLQVESEKRYRNLFNQANEGLLIMTLEGKLFEVNEAFAKMHGYTIEEIRKLRIQDLDANKEETFEKNKELMEKQLNGKAVRFEVEHFHKDGHIFPLSVTSSLITIDDQKFFMAFHQDISEKKEMEKLLKMHEEKLNFEIKKSLIYGQENERKRIAREIHDGLCQVLSVADMKVSKLKSTNSGHEKDLNEATDIIKASLNEAIRISNNLSPTVLVDFGLLAGLKKLIKLNSSNSAVEIILRAGPYTERLPQEIELAFYRITQEAIRNAINHSGCTKIYVICYKSEKVKLKIIDNGKGLDIDDKDKPRGFGLSNMQERAKMIEKEIIIHSKPGKFTSISISY